MRAAKTSVLLLVAMTWLPACVVESGTGPRGVAPAEHDTDVEPEAIIDAESCDDGVIEDCKVWIDDDNCFVGERICEDGVWSECMDADMLETSAVDVSIDQRVG